MHQPSLPLQRTLTEELGGEAMEGVETLPAPRATVGSVERDSREEMDLTKGCCYAKRETPCSHAFPHPADPLL